MNDDETPARRRDLRAADAPADAAAPPAPLEVVEASAEVALGVEASALPGEHRGGFARELTAPVGIAQIAEHEPEDAADWAPAATVPLPRRRPRLAEWALGLAVVALAASVFVVWALPFAIGAVVFAILALRRRVGPRAVAVWALVLGAAATAYSVGWLVWAVVRLPVLFP